MSNTGTNKHNLLQLFEVPWVQDATKKSQVFSAGAIGAIVGILPSVPLIDTIGLRLSLSISGLLSAIGSFLFPFAVSYHYHLMIICRILQGLGTSLLFTAIGVIPNTWAPISEISTFIAILSCEFQLSNVICMPISGILCESSLGWQSIYYIFGASTFLFYAIFFIFYDDDPKNHRTVMEQELRKIQSGKVEPAKLKTPYKAICMDFAVLASWSSIFGANIGFFVLVLYGPTYLKEILNFDVQSTGFATALPFLLAALGKVIVGRLSDNLTQYSEKTRFTACALISQIGVAGAFVVLGLTENSGVGQVAYTFAIFASGLNIMGTIKSIQLRCHQFVHFAAAMIAFQAFIIQFLTPMAVGFLCPNNLPEEWSHLFLLTALAVLLFNVPFPFLTSDQPGIYISIY